MFVRGDEGRTAIRAGNQEIRKEEYGYEKKKRGIHTEHDRNQNKNGSYEK